MNEQCSNCRYWRPRGDAGKVGECQRFPPTFRPPKDEDTPSRWGKWPWTKPDDRCGEFKAGAGS